MPEPRKCIRSLPPNRSPITGRTELNLDLNENALGCSPRVLAKLRSLTAEDIARYPDREAGERVVADFLGLPWNNVLLTNGIDEALQLMFGAHLDENSELIVPDPSFSMFQIYGRATGAKIRAIPYSAEFTFPTEEILSAIGERTRIVVIANPNNPTGTAASPLDLVSIARSAPDAAVIIDEAYFEFYGQTLIGELARIPNLFVVRTFSKAYGLAGLRLGVVVGPPQEIDLLRRLSSPFNINAVALAVLREALSDVAFVNSYVEQVAEGRKQLYQLCRDLGIRFWQSHTNFILTEIGPHVADFVSLMRSAGIAISDRTSDRGCAGCIRLTIPSREQMPRLLKTFRDSVRAMPTSKLKA